jgi:hypothetical protein
VKLRLVTALSCAVLLAAVAVPAAGAGAPTRFTEHVDMTFFAVLTSAVCGFPVFVNQEGTVDVILWQGADGTTVVRETDWNAGVRTTFTAPTQGTSFSYPSGGQLHTEYPEGAILGKPAIATFAGFSRKIGDDPAEAGRVVMSAVVTFVDPATGIPGIETLDVLSGSGHFLGDTLARRCAALTAP